MTDKEKSIEEFVKFTCCTEAEAKSYLENAAWNTEAALVMYFDDRDDRVDPSTLGCSGPSADLGDRDSENDSMHAEDDDYADVEAPQSFDFQSSPEKKSSKNETPKTYKPTTNVATLSSLRGAQDDEDDDDDQLYYAGGSEHSGQQIMGNDRRGDVAGEVFKSLKQMVTVGEVELAGPSKDSKKRFSGVGYRLGQTPDDTQIIGSARQPDESRPELHLRLWRDGFTIGDEPLRPYSDPENRETIDLLLRGEVPMHLVPPGTRGGKVNVKVEDVRHERYTGPSSRGRFFTGPGHVLGNVVPEIVKNESSQPQTIEKEPEKTPKKSPIEVNESEPTTNIAVRLPNGTRSQVRLNLSHTVEDLRRHLLSVHGDLDGQSFAFMVSFPPKEVLDEKLSIVDAGLVNSSLHLRINKN